MAILGYNVPRPTPEQYGQFEEQFVGGLREHSEELEGLSLMLYGSYARGEHNPGVSDIDGVLIFETDSIVTDKNKLDLCSRIMAEALEGKTLPIGIGVQDSTTLEDGLFLTYNSTQYGEFQRDGRIVIGEDYRDKMQLPELVDPVVQEIGFKLKKSRTGLLMARHHFENNYDYFLDLFRKSAESSCRFYDQFEHLIGIGEYSAKKTGGIAEFEETYGKKYGLDLTFTKELATYLDDGEKMTELYNSHNLDEFLRLWNGSLTEFERGLDLVMSIRRGEK